MKRYQVRITSEAEQDIEQIYNYIAQEDSPTRADHVLEKLETLITSLQTNPQRGHYPPELERQGIRTYREVHFKPFRIIYEVLDSRVIIHVCVDGRRDMQTLLGRRLYR